MRRKKYYKRPRNIKQERYIYLFIQYPYYNYNLLNKYPSVKEVQDIFSSQNNLNNEGDLEKMDKSSLFLSPQPFFNIKKIRKERKDIFRQKES